jgi:REP element-mobilizing transposase RayT
MAIKGHSKELDTIYFVTFTILKWRSVFDLEPYCDFVYKWFDYMTDNYGNKIYGYVIMPNHIHCLIYLSEKSPVLSKVIQNAKRFMAYQIVKQLELDGNNDLLKFFAYHAERDKGAKHKVFEDGFDSKVIKTQKFFEQKLNYIHTNPCRAPWYLASAPDEYKHSSAASYINGEGFYTVDIPQLW